MVSKEPERKSVKQAAIEVLRKAGEPLKSDEITRRVLPNPAPRRDCQNPPRPQRP